MGDIIVPIALAPDPHSDDRFAVALMDGMAIRLKIQALQEAARDFLIQSPVEHGVPGLATCLASNRRA